MRKRPRGHFARMTSKHAFWIILAALVALSFITYIGFSLHEQRNNVKLRLRQTTRKLFLPDIKDPEDEPYQDTYPINITMIHTEDELTKYSNGYKLHAFNVLVSDRIGFHSRPIPDTRPEGCKSEQYDLQAQTSVIICYYNEALSTLLRTISSVFKKTSPKLLKEVIVVDDGSTEEYSSMIEKFVQNYYLAVKLHVLRSSEQMGLIKARMFGARHATGDTLVFLDSHCEVNVGWIEPLLQELVNHTSKVVCPVVDTIHSNTFEYEASEQVRGGFNWGLHFSWEQLPRIWKYPLKAYPTPTISGGLFAVNRDSFFALGGYDEGMEEWGGENLEISFRTWMCGGSLEIASCSRVGHVFRSRRPYGGKDNAALRNAVRVAKVWLDDYKLTFMNTRTGANSVDVGDLSDRIQLRKRLKCRSFRWYLDTVYPEIDIPGVRKTMIKYSHFKPETTITAHGAIQVSGLSICLTGDEAKGSPMQASQCKDNDISQTWAVTSDGEVRFGNKMCLDGSSLSPHLMKCDGSHGFQKWSFLKNGISADDRLIGRLYNVAAGLCISVNQVGDTFETALRICHKPSVQTFSIKLV